MAHYIHDDKNNRIEGMSKEEIYALLAAAIQQGQLPSVDDDTAFVTMFKSIVDGKTYKMGFCTQAQYNELEAEGLLEVDTYYIITDDTTYDDLVNVIDGVNTSLNDALIAIANQLNTKKININNSDGFIFGDNEGYITIEGANDITFKYDNNKTFNASDIFKSIPVNVPIDSGNTSCDIANYGLGLYEVTITKTDGNNQYYFTGIISIIEEGNKSYNCYIPAGTSSQSIEWVGISGVIGTVLGVELHEISITTTGTSLGYTIAKCTRLIKY